MVSGNYFTEGFHTEPASHKLSNDWFKKACSFYFDKTYSVVQDKDVEEIDSFANGDFSIEFVKKVFVSEYEKERKEKGIWPSSKAARKRERRNAIKMFDMDCLPLIESRLTAAVEAIDKIPFEFKPKCLDSVAFKRKNQDLELLRYRKENESVVQDLYDQMGLGKYEAPKTEYSHIPYGVLPLGLDEKNDEDFKIFAEIIYNYAPEYAFKTLLKTLYEVNRIYYVRNMEIKDQFKYAVSCNQSVIDDVTGLPEIKYLHPSLVYASKCLMPDYSDRNATRVCHYVTPNEMLSMFGDEINGLDGLKELINGKSGGNINAFSGYLECEGGLDTSWKVSEFATQKVKIWYWEIKSTDYALVSKKKGKYGEWNYYTENPNDPNLVGKQWAQNIYCAYQLGKTGAFFKKRRLPGFFRTKGQEAFISSSINIYKSKEQSSVELSIGENKKAMMAYAKLIYHIIRARVPGVAFDVKSLRDAVMVQSKEGPDKRQDFEQVVVSAIQNNMFAYDSSGFEGKVNGQYKPVFELTGGIRREEVSGYYEAIMDADRKIAQFMGVNDPLLGQDVNQDALVGLQKMMINQSINSINYVQRGLKSNYQNAFSHWATLLQSVIKEKKSPYEFLLNIIGSGKMDIIKAMDDIPLHSIGVIIDMGLTTEEKEFFKAKVRNMSAQGMINSADEVFILGIDDHQEAAFVLASLEHKRRVQDMENQEANRQAMLQMKQQEGQNIIAGQEAASSFRMRENEAELMGKAKLMELASKLKLNESQMENLSKRFLQSERINLTSNNRMEQLAHKNTAEQQASMLR